MDNTEIAFTGHMFPGNNALRPWPPNSPGPTSSAVLLAKAPSPVASEALPSISSDRAVVLPGSGSALGVDWSGSIKAGKKVWAARIVFDQATGHRLDFVRRPFLGRDAGGVAAGFGTWLQKQSFETAGLDFCFGVARQ